MQFDGNMLLVVYCVSGMISALLAWYGFHHRETPVSVYFALLMTAVAAWTAFTILSLLSGSLEEAALWRRGWFAGLSTTPVFLLLFILEYTGRGMRITRGTVFLLFIIPAAGQLLMWIDTNIIINLQFERVGGLITVLFDYGPWFFVHMVYSYFLIALSIFFISRMISGSRKAYRKQAISLLAGILFPLFINLLLTLKVVSIRVEFTIIGFTFTGMLFAWAIYRYRFIDLMPMARSQVLDMMQDAYLVIDRRERVVDLNTAAAGIIGMEPDSAVGGPAARVLGAWPEFARGLRQDTHHTSGILVPHGAANRHYEARFIPLVDPHGDMHGKLVLMHDITERVKAGEAVRKETELARTVQQNIMKTTADIPHIRHLYRPMREVGGDIIEYISFREPGKTGIFIGDVSGHGVPTALISAMVIGIIRQMRDASLSPGEFLDQLNEALYGNTSDYFITALYAIHDRNTGELAYSSAGHYWPIHIANDGIRELTGKTVVPLGLFCRSELKTGWKGSGEQKIILKPGERVLLYTDGLSEAMSRDGRNIIFGETLMMDCIGKHGELHLPEYIDAIYGDLVLFHGSEEFEDDLSIVCLEQE